MMWILVILAVHLVLSDMNTYGNRLRLVHRDGVLRDWERDIDVLVIA